MGVCSWNVRILSTSLSFRNLYRFVIYYLVCKVNFELLYAVCMVFVGAKNHSCFNLLITSLNFKKLKLHLPRNVRKSAYRIQIYDVGIAPNLIQVITLSKWAGNYRMKSNFRSECLFVTARQLWKFIQSSTERTEETKIPDWFAAYMRKLHSCFTSCGGIGRICSTFDIMWPQVCGKSIGDYRT